MNNREAFEATYSSVFPAHRLDRDANGDYVNIAADAAWHVYQAAQAPASGEAVAWMSRGGSIVSEKELSSWLEYRGGATDNIFNIPLYTTPPATAVPEWVNQVVAERQRQDEKWGGPEHDDQKSPNDFVQHIEDYAGWARVMAGMGSFEKYRRRMVQVAALAGAAIEASDRAIARSTQPPKQEN